MPKLSAANGIVYTYTKDPQPDDQDAWYLTALDFRTGKTLYKRLGGEGLGHNNNYAPITLGPDGTAYVGVLGGLIGLRDATPPPGAAGGPPAGAGGSAPPRLAAAEGPAPEGRPRAGCGSSARASGRSAASRSGCAASGCAWTASGRSERPSRASG